MLHHNTFLCVMVVYVFRVICGHNSHSVASFPGFIVTLCPFHYEYARASTSLEAALTWGVRWVGANQSTATKKWVKLQKSN